MNPRREGPGQSASGKKEDQRLGADLERAQPKAEALAMREVQIAEAAKKRLAQEAIAQQLDAATVEGIRARIYGAPAAPTVEEGPEIEVGDLFQELAKQDIAEAQARVKQGGNVAELIQALKPSHSNPDENRFVKQSLLSPDNLQAQALVNMSDVAVTAEERAKYHGEGYGIGIHDVETPKVQAAVAYDRRGRPLPRAQVEGVLQRSAPSEMEVKTASLVSDVRTQAAIMFSQLSKMEKQLVIDPDDWHVAIDDRKDRLEQILLKLHEGTMTLDEELEKKKSTGDGVMGFEELSAKKKLEESIEKIKNLYVTVESFSKNYAQRVQKKQTGSDGRAA
jgi:hypothetical protein